MKARYVGKQIMDYINKDGKRIQGLNMHLTGTSRKVEGTAVSVLYISKSDYMYEKAIQLPTNVDLDIDFDASGTIQDIIELSKCEI